MPSRNFNLTDHFNQFIDTQVGSGKFRSADEVVEEALRQMEARVPKAQPISTSVVETSEAEIELGSLSDISALMSQMQREVQAAEAEEED